MDWTSSLHDVIFTAILNSDEESSAPITQTRSTFHSSSRAKLFAEEEEKSTNTKVERV